MIGNIADFRTYQAERGNTAPTDATDDAATQALVRGSDYVTRAFDLIVEETDSRVVEAAYIAAGYELTTPGFFSQPGSDKILTRVGEIEWTVNNGKGSNLDSMSPYEEIKAVLRGAIVGSQGLLRA